MKEVKLVERKSTTRLLSLIGEIPELILNNDFISARDGRPMYYLTTGKIWTMYNRGEIEKNPLKNAYKLKLACDNGIRKITEESFCDLLEEHLYLVAKEKMEELLPQIQEHFPEAVIKNAEENDAWYIWERPDQYSIIVAWNGYDYKYVNGAYERIWEDKENLIVKKPKPWWEKQGEMYVIVDGKFNIEFRVVESDIQECNYEYISARSGKIIFGTKEEAQSMCDKLNAVLRGE